jgi:BCD family chlorophyll transporter-like MFS transporter
MRMSGYGAALGLFAFAAVILAAPLQSPLLFKVGAVSSASAAASSPLAP